MRSTSLLVAGGRARIEELLDLVGLPRGRGRSLSAPVHGGQRQRIAVARALAAEPSVLVLDEPLASLDASAQAQVANLLVDLSRRLSLSLLLISHDLAIVRHVADVVSVMYLGVIVESGPTPLWSLPLHPYTEALIERYPVRTGAACSRSAVGRGARSSATSGRLPVSSALPVRLRPLFRRGAVDDRGRRLAACS